MENLGVSKVAISILKKAVELDNRNIYTGAFSLYLEAITLLLEDTKGMASGEKKNALNSKITGYITRAEVLKKHIESEKRKGTYCEQIRIENNSTGHSYDSVFGRFLDHKVSEIHIEDPYIRAFHQCQNFLCACELFVKKCENLKVIHLITTMDSNHDQMKWLESIRCDLSFRYKVDFVVEFSTTLHDRQIKLNSGWVIKIGRGLDYFKAPDNKFTLGVHDLDLRPCHETVVDIYQKLCS